MSHDLQDLLHIWQVRIKPDAYFASAVWRRIEAWQARLQRNIWWRSWNALASPAWAVAAVLTIALLGVFTGRQWNHLQKEQARLQGEIAYLQAVNPFVHTLTPRP